MGQFRLQLHDDYIVNKHYKYMECSDRVDEGCLHIYSEPSPGTRMQHALMCILNDRHTDSPLMWPDGRHTTG